VGGVTTGATSSVSQEKEKTIKASKKYLFFRFNF